MHWSHDLLTPPEQALLRRMSIFAGGCTLEAAEAVCVGGVVAVGDVLEILAGLVAKSLTGADMMDGAARYRLLETVRAYSQERLGEAGEADELRQRHALWGLDLAEWAEAELVGPEQEMWLTRLEAEHDNLRRALSLLRDHAEPDLGLRLGAALWRFWYTRGLVREGDGWLDRLLARGGSAAVRARALSGAGNLAWSCGDCVRAAALHAESLALRRALGDTRGVASSLTNLGIVVANQGDDARAAALHAESVALWREVGDAWGLACAFSNLGIVVANQGDDARAVTLHTESLALRRGLGDTRGIAASLGNLGTIAHRRGDCAAATAAHAESLALCRTLGDKEGIATALNDLGAVACDEGNAARAWTLLTESLALHRGLGGTRHAVECLENLAPVLTLRDQPALSAQFLSDADALRATLGVPRPPRRRAAYELSVAQARQALGAAGYADAWATGQAISLDRLIDRVLAMPAPMAAAEGTARP